MEAESNWRKLGSWKKRIVIITAIIVIIRIGYIVIGGEVDKKYYAYPDYNISNATDIPCKGLSQTFTPSNNRLYSVEFLFSNIAADKTGAIVFGIYSEDDELIYQTNISLSNINNQEWKKIFVNAEMETGKHYVITLDANGNCTQVPTVYLINPDYDSEVQASFRGEEELEGQIAIKYGYLQFPGRLDRLVMSSLWIFYSFSYYWSFRK